MIICLTTRLSGRSCLHFSHYIIHITKKMIVRVSLVQSNQKEREHLFKTKGAKHFFINQERRSKTCTAKIVRNKI